MSINGFSCAKFRMPISNQSVNAEEATGFMCLDHIMDAF